MKKALLFLVMGVFLGTWGTALPAAAGSEDPIQGPKAAPAGFELKMRILEGVRERSPEPAKPVTSSFLKFLSFANFEQEQDLAAEQQIKKVYSLKDVNLLTEAALVWEKGKTEKAFHMFRLNGQEYLVMVTPGSLPERNQFRIEVYEQSRDNKTSLLDTEFKLPDKSAAVFGFEDTELKPYFISLRLVGWSGVLGGVVGGVVGGASGGGKIMPPKLVKEVEPAYPAEARKARIEGVVIMEATTDLYGRVAVVKILRSIPALDQAAMDAVQQWVYEPMIVDGKPRPVTFTVTLQFTLDDEKKPKAGGVVGGVYGGVVSGVSGGVQGGVTGGVEGGVKGGVAGGVESAQELKKFEGDAVRAVGDVQPPKLIKEVFPKYPEVARQARVEGIVILEAKTDEQGSVIDARILHSIPLLDQAAIDAVKQWIYEPMRIDGKPRKILFTVTVRFALHEGTKEDAMDAFAAGAVRAIKDIMPPKIVKEVRPVYPEIARQSKVEGVVILGVKTDETGKVVDVMILRSIPLLDQAAIDTVRQWVYEPLVIDGKATPVVFTVTVRFQLH
ncbi:MAG: energy transducer TonB [Candidatus Aminicenantes bacterium]|nr:energy transducer TonB [Candidatus Aminicenantes bacterium]